MESYIKYSDSGMDDGELVIDSIYVSKAERGQGKGKQLVLEALEHARQNEYLTVGLYAEPQTDDGLDGDALIEFYLALGFESSGEDSAMMTYTV